MKRVIFTFFCAFVALFLAGCSFQTYTSAHINYNSPNQLVLEELKSGKLDITKGERVVSSGVSRGFCIFLFCFVKPNEQEALLRALQSSGSDLMVDGSVIKRSRLLLIFEYLSTEVTGRVLKSSEISTQK